MRDLIIGLGNLPFPLMAKFFASLRDIKFAGDVCLFVYDIDLATVGALRSHGVIIENGRAFVRSERYVMCSRFFMYQDFLSRNHGRYDRVMLTDVRDVIFQSDPFANIGDADVVYACERTLIRDCPMNADWVRRAYGDAVYENLGDYLVSCAGTTFGTMEGILGYLSAMIDEMSMSRAVNTNVDQGIHNFVVHMRPLRGAFFDVHDNNVATLQYMPPECLAVTDRGIEVDGRVVPVVHQWDRRTAVRDYVLTADRLKPSGPAPSRRRGPAGQPAARRADGSEAIICYRPSERNAVKLDDFAKYIRETGYLGAIGIVGVGFVADEVEAARAHGCQLLQVGSDYATRAPDAAAHLYFNEMLPQVGADDLFLIDNLGAIFVGNPFPAKTIGVSLFAEGVKRLRDSQEHTRQLALFGAPDARVSGRQIVSSRLLCGRRAEIRGFYAALFREFEGKQHLLETPGAIQAAFNKIAWSDHRGLPITVRPNGSLAYIARWPTAMTVETEPVLRVGGAAPAVVLGPDRSGDSR
jgi:hypothetical protein